MQAIAENIANLHTTRIDGQKNAYQRQEVIFEEVRQESQGQGVKVAEIVNDPMAPRRIYRPGHPDADGQGYVEMPNVDIHFEMVDLISAARAYQANLVAMRLSRDMAQQALNLG